MANLVPSPLHGHPGDWPGEPAETSGAESVMDTPSEVGMIQRGLECDGETTKAEELGLDDGCVICYEQGPFVTLPCKCAMKYCASCWDHAMACSIWSCGMARCPTCRSAFGVDLDVETCSLAFAIDPEASEEQCQLKAVRQLQAWFISKTRDMHISLLQEHGAAIRRRQESACNDEAEPQTQSPPPCVCGGELQPTATRERLLQLYGDTHKLCKLKGESVHALLACAICGADAHKCKAFWSCSKGLRTAMHPVGRDVCGACFQQHSGLDAPLDEPEKEAPKKAKASRFRYEMLPFLLVVLAIIVMAVVFLGGSRH